MFINDVELIKLKLTAEGRMNDSEIIKNILNSDLHSPQKIKMNEGQRYYSGDHDILRHDFLKSIVYTEKEDQITHEKVKQEEIFENKNRSNHKNVNNFYQILVDQKVAYIVGETPVISVEGAKSNAERKAFEDMVTMYIDENFADVLCKWMYEAANKYVGWLHPYYDEEGSLKYIVIPSEECIPVYDTRFQKELVAMIRCYTITVYTGRREVQRKKLEWHTKEGVTYYTEDSETEGLFILDPDYAVNPASHFSIITKDGEQNVIKTEGASWGRVPFIPLYNNDDGTIDLESMRGLQDGYNLISSIGTNDQIDLIALYWTIKGYGGDTAAEIIRKLQINKAVSIEDPTGAGGINSHQIQLGTADRIAWLGMLKKDIFTCGMGVDTSSEKIGNAISGESLKFQYSNLDLKAGKTIPKLKLALSEFFKYVTEDINRKNGTNYDSRLIKTNIKKSKITNVLEEIRAINESRGLVPDNQLLEKHPYVDDVNEAIKDMQKQKEEETKRMREAYGDEA